MNNNKKTPLDIRHFNLKCSKNFFESKIFLLDKPFNFLEKLTGSPKKKKNKKRKERTHKKILFCEHMILLNMVV